MSLTQRPELRRTEILSFPRALPEPFVSRQIFYTMNGRNAIYHALKALGVQKGTTVLLPAFHCTALVDPVIAYGCSVKFYTVHRDLSLDMDEIAALAHSGASALLFVHFFGYPAPVHELAEIARSFSMKLVEDCTHTLTGTIDDQPVGTFGDAAIFSLRKILPVPDGGILLLNKSKKYLPVLKSPLTYHLRMAKWAFETNVEMSTKHDAAPQQALHTEKVEISASSRKGPASHEDPEFYAMWRNWSISKISKMILQRTDLEDVRQKRIDNFNRILTGFLDHEEVKLFSKDSMQLCPLGFPFTSDSPDRIDYQLRRLGIPAFSFGEDLHPRLDLRKFPDAKYLSEHLVLLPVHQNLSEANIAVMLKATKTIFQNSTLQV